MRNERQRRKAGAPEDTPPSPPRPPHASVPVIGLVGGVGAGKTLVASQFRRLGCSVVDADRIGHQVLRQGGVRAAIRRRFGRRVFTASGAVSRRRLAERVFGDARARRALERIVHPEICRRIRRAVDRARRGRRPAVVLDAPLILEKGLDNLCDHVLYIGAPAEVRRRRAARARGWGSEETARREASQDSLKSKQDRADYTVDNSASPEHTFEQVRRIFSRVTL